MSNPADPSIADPKLAAIASAFRRTLPSSAMVSVFRIDGVDRLGWPVVQAALVPEDGNSVIGYGYGANETAASVGALGELCEEVHVGAWLATAPSTSASTRDLIATHGVAAVADPLTLCLSAGSDYTADMELEWVAARRWADGQTVMVPREWVAAYSYQLATPARLITPITNGLGAGLDVAHAVAHGLMELLQRDGNVLSYRALDQGVVIDVGEEAPELRALIDRLSEHGIAARVKLACTDFGLANVYVVGEDGASALPIQMSACGEACHPDAHAAIRKALLEFVGSRARKAATHGPIPLLRQIMPRAYGDMQLRCAMQEEEEPRALEAMTSWVGGDGTQLRAQLAATLFADRRHVAFSALPSVARGAADDAGARLAILSERLAEEGLDILWVDCSPAGSEVRVVKVIVPGLESETMSYHRIGWRGVRRLRERGDPLILGAERDGAARVRLRPADEARAGGPAWFDAARADQIVAAFYPLYREPGPFTAQLLLQRRRGEVADAV